jgi:PPK2 family polyphosphate:nucleotide phosphotransferase
MNISEFRLGDHKKVKLSKINTGNTGKIKSKEEAKKQLLVNIEKMSDLQGRLYAQGQYSLLLILQAMDTAGKDGVIKHVMAGLNAQATQVHSFKQPSAEELNHDYLWRASRHLPERGNFGIFNRSYYEEVLVVRVHDLVKSQKLPESCLGKDIWENRYRQIRDYEKYLAENGTVIIKIFLHISKAEQKQRLLSRITDKSKNWKFSEADIQERQYWDQYQACYEEAVADTNTTHGPWYIVPADKKWYSRLVISEIIVKTLEDLKLEYPVLDKRQGKALQQWKQKLLAE